MNGLQMLYGCSINALQMLKGCSEDALYKGPFRQPFFPEESDDEEQVHQEGQEVAQLDRVQLHLEQGAGRRWREGRGELLK